MNTTCREVSPLVPRVIFIGLWSYSSHELVSSRTGSRYMLAVEPRGGIDEAPRRGSADGEAPSDLHRQLGKERRPGKQSSRGIEDQ